MTATGISLAEFPARTGIAGTGQTRRVSGEESDDAHAWCGLAVIFFLENVGL